MGIEHPRGWLKVSRGEGAQLSRDGHHVSIVQQASTHRDRNLLTPTFVGISLFDFDTPPGPHWRYMAK